MALDTLIVMTGNLIAGVSNVLYYFVAGRLLPVAEYGALTAVISFTTLFLLAFSPLQIALTRSYAQHLGLQQTDQATTLMHESQKKIFLGGALLLLCGILMAETFAHFLQASPRQLAIGAAIVTLSLLTINYTAFINAHQRFAPFALFWALSAMLTLATGSLLMLNEGTAVEGMTGLLAGPVLLFIATAWLSGRQAKATASPPHEQEEGTPSHPLQHLLPSLLAVAAFASLTNIDMILVKHHFEPDMAGYYSLAQTLGKITLFIPFTLATVLLPKSVIAHINEGSAQHLLTRALWISGLLCAFAVALLFLFTDLAVTLLSGEPHADTLPLVPPFALAMMFLSLTWVTIHYAIGIGYFGFVMPLLLFAFLEGGAIAFFHTSLQEVVTILLLASIATFGTCYFTVYRHHRMVLAEQAVTD